MFNLQDVSHKIVNVYNSLLDGEHVLHNKDGKFINLFLAFDIYFNHKVDVRSLPFLGTGEILSEMTA